jgi:pimeloyl-ACP methyl ester carboxylesterase
LTEEEKAFLAAHAAWFDSDGGYGRIQATKPQSLAYGLNDSPVGLAGWLIEKFRASSDCDGDVQQVFSRDELLTNISIHWYTRTISSSMRLYWETGRRTLRFGPGERICVPCGHFAALEQPELLAQDIRAFFRRLRTV